MVFSETIHAMLLTHDKFRQFTPKKLADAKATSEVLICLSADNREGVDDMVRRAGAAGGTIVPSPIRTTASCTAAASRILTDTSGK